MATAYDGGGQRRSLVIALTIVALALTLAGGLLAGAKLDADAAPATPAEGSVDVGFLRDMQDHHAQAVRMSVLVRDATKDPAVRTLALDILLTQQQQIGQMFGRLSEWGLPQSSGAPPMQWMTSSGGMAMPSGGSMPGMASPADLRRLAQARGRDAERLYLQLMIPHHKGAIGMARYAAQRAQDPHVRRMATSILTAQSAEIRVLRSMLAARGGPLGAS